MMGHPRIALASGSVSRDSFEAYGWKQACLLFRRPLRRQCGSFFACRDAFRICLLSTERIPTPDEGRRRTHPLALDGSAVTWGNGRPHSADPKIHGAWAGGSTRRSAAEPGPGGVDGCL